ncbi:MAG: hypothetical protein P1V18_00075 [Candidatus Gracilibacteria bacterium]|nr:hypothetical protein [Candidatus Gracilibacteria bacterium]
MSEKMKSSTDSDSNAELARENSYHKEDSNREAKFKLIEKSMYPGMGDTTKKVFPLYMFISAYEEDHAEETDHPNKKRSFRSLRAPFYIDRADQQVYKIVNLTLAQVLRVTGVGAIDKAFAKNESEVDYATLNIDAEIDALLEEAKRSLWNQITSATDGILKSKQMNKDDKMKMIKESIKKMFLESNAPIVSVFLDSLSNFQIVKRPKS